ncbi:MAG: hypothetical protein JXL97_08015 [Bacteroidales bacterium]|nr:hypothetical protein [Bacteroidales bacterium]
MKKIIYITILSFFVLLSGCTMSKHYLKHGNYDMATKEAVKKLRKNKDKTKHILVIEQAYPKAQEIDQARIEYLHTEGEPDRWDEIFHLYSNMEIRQVLVEGVTPLYVEGREVSFEHVDYDELLVEAKLRAAAYYYAHAKKLMEDNNRFSYRQAYAEFEIAKSYTSSYSDIESLITECYNKGLAHVIIIAVNSTPFQLPDDFMINLIDFPVSDLSSFWVNYYSRDTRNGNYDVFINVTLTIADVSRNEMTNSEFSESKKIEDGWEYQLDDDGNIVKDEDGNAIKIPKYKTITCRVIKTRQFKQAHIQGALNYVDANSNQIVRSIPIAADHTFEHYYYKADGDLNALSNETRSLLKSTPISYPLDVEMIYAANQTLRDVIYHALMDNRVFINQRY